MHYTHVRARGGNRGDKKIKKKGSEAAGTAAHAGSEMLAASSQTDREREREKETAREEEK